MINRDNLKVEIDFGNNFCAAVSVSKNQWAVAEEVIAQMICQNSSLKLHISGWQYHNAGYTYKEVLSNSFEAIDKIALEISVIPVK